MKRLLVDDIFERVLALIAELHPVAPDAIEQAA